LERFKYNQVFLLSMDISPLKEAGLTEGEIRVYLALLELGLSTSGPILEKSGITKSIIYRILDKLIKKTERAEEQRIRRKRADKARREREAEIDKQIEESIETELQHTLRAKKSIEEVVQVERKPARGINEEKLDELLWDLEVGLLESDVAYTVIESIKKDIKEELRHVSIERGKVGELVEKVLRNAIIHVLTSSELDFDDFIKKNKKPIVIMFVGVNGSGKTLSIAKIATMLKKQGKSSVMAAGDTFRAGAIEQLGIHADKVGVKLIRHGPGSDPSHAGERAGSGPGTGAATTA